MRLLEVIDVMKTYKRRCVVNRVSFHLDEGEIVGLLGPNGAGKTTTFLMSVGRVRPDSGQVRFKERDVTRMPMYQRARLGLGYLSQERSDFQKLTVEDNILAILETQPLNRHERKIRLGELLEELDLVNLRKNRAYTLSGGERRRLEITRALASKPDLILLDEPFAGVDPIAVAETQEIVRGLKKRNISVLLTDHNVRETLSITDRSYIIAEGRIIKHGNARELVDDPTVRKVYLGEKFSMAELQIPAVSEEDLLEDGVDTTDDPPKPGGTAKDDASDAVSDDDAASEASGPLYRRLQDEATGPIDDDEDAQTDESSTDDDSKATKDGASGSKSKKSSSTRKPADRKKPSSGSSARKATKKTAAKKPPKPGSGRKRDAS